MGYFLHNLRYLFMHKIEDSLRKNCEQTVDIMDQYYRYSLLDGNLSIARLCVLDSMQTVSYIESKKPSFCRFGDGEFELIMGNSIPFQKYDKKLADALRRILKSDVPEIEIGVPYMHFHAFESVNECAKKFMLYGVPRYRKFMLENCLKEKVYIDAAFTQVYMSNSMVDVHNYYTSVKKMFMGGSFVLFIGRGIMSSVQYNVFDDAEKLKIVEAPTCNAYSSYKKLLQQALSYSKDFTLCFVLGPTAKVLTFELAKHGYTAWDIGHLIQDYDAYMKNIERSTDNVVEFFSPD